MDSRDIYNQTKRTIKWQNDWIYIGTQEQIKINRVVEILNKHFIDYETLLLKRGRTNSEQLDSKNIIQKIELLDGNEHFEIWSSDFKKAIQFSRMGVIRLSMI